MNKKNIIIVLIILALLYFIYVKFFNKEKKVLKERKDWELKKIGKKSIKMGPKNGFWGVKMVKIVVGGSKKTAIFDPFFWSPIWV